MTVTRDLVVVFKGVDKTLSSTANKLSGPFNKLGGTIKAGAAIGATAIVGLGAATIGLGAQLIALGSDAEEAMGKFNVVFANTGERVKSALGDFASEVGRSRFELFEMASTFGDTLKPMGFTEDAASDLAVQMSTLATDLGSFNNMPMDEALQRLQGTLIGSHENALAFGVIINENTLKAELAANGWDNLTGAALEQAKVQARINLLMSGTTDAQGDAARTAGSWANQMRSLKSTLIDTATEIGLGLLPVVTPLLSSLGEMAKNVLPKLGTIIADTVIPAIKDIINFFKGFFDGLQNGLGIWDAAIESLLTWTNLGENMPQDMFDFILEADQWFRDFKTTVSELVSPILDWINANFELQDVLIGLGVILGGVILSAIIGIASTILSLAIPIGLVIGAAALFREAWERDFLGIRTAVTEWSEEHGGIMQGIIDWWNDLGTTWEQLSFIIKFGASLIKVFWLELKLTWLQLRFIVAGGIELLSRKWEKMKDDLFIVVGAIKMMWEGLKSKFIEVKNSILRTIQPIVNILLSLKNILGNISLPPWMTPGSPTPWEIGLKGVRNELASLYRQDLPALQTSMQGLQQVNNRNTNITQTTNVFTSSFDVGNENRANLRFATGGI